MDKKLTPRQLAKQLLEYSINDTIHNWYTREREIYGMAELSKDERDLVQAYMNELAFRLNKSITRY